LTFARVLLMAALACVAPPARASDAPAPLRDKTIFVSWTAHRVVMTAQGERTPTVHVERMIYVSSLGRAFVKSRLESPRGPIAHEMGPADSLPQGGAREIDFVGNQLVAMAQRGSGAGRMIITFDASFTTCRVENELARPSGGQLMKRAPGGGTVQILSTEFSDLSCAIRDGNLVAP
jgi:hypothetical protein